MERQKIPISEIRELASRFTAQDIELCISEQIEKGQNECKTKGHHEEVVNELAKAVFVKELVEAGSPMSEAVRELARRIRSFQQQGDA